MVLEEITQFAMLKISNFIGGIRLYTQTQKENDIRPTLFTGYRDWHGA